MKLRAIIFGMQEYEESPVDYANKTEAGVLAAQVAIGIEDPISFVTPDNIQVKVESVVGAYTEEDFNAAKIGLGHLLAAVSDSSEITIPVDALKDDRLRLHWAAARFHLNELQRLL